MKMRTVELKLNKWVKPHSRHKETQSELEHRGGEGTQTGAQREARGKSGSEAKSYYGRNESLRKRIERE